MSIEFPEGIYPPEGGWEPSTWYLVDVSCRYGNPVHKSLLYTGFLDEHGKPAGYSGITPGNYAPDKRAAPIGSYRYVKVVKKLWSLKEDVVIDPRVATYVYLVMQIDEAGEWQAEAIHASESGAQQKVKKIVKEEEYTPEEAEHAVDYFRFVILP